MFTMEAYRSSVHQGNDGWAVQGQQDLGGPAEGQKLRVRPDRLGRRQAGGSGNLGHRFGLRARRVFLVARVRASVVGGWSRTEWEQWYGSTPGESVNWLRGSPGHLLQLQQQYCASILNSQVRTPALRKPVLP